jgi:hypothetical protein
VALLGSLVLLLDQEVLATERTTELPANKGARRRLEAGLARSKRTPDVIVITLRRIVRERRDAPRPVAWSCRWISRGHWRRWRDARDGGA